jgi:PAS domain S-box-containing protein
MMEMVDVGMFEYDQEGVLLYGNDAFHSLTGVPKGNDEPMVWANWVFEEDKAWLTDVWTALTKGGSNTFEMRWLGPNPDENPEGQWVTAACVPTTRAGNVVTVSGCVTDISAQKRSHSDAVKKAEALERAAASELRFSDFIKHSNSAFYNFGMDRKVSTGHTPTMFECSLVSILTLLRCVIAIVSGSKSVAIPSCLLRILNGICSWIRQISQS